MTDKTVSVPQRRFRVIIHSVRCHANRDGCCDVCSARDYLNEQIPKDWTATELLNSLWGTFMKEQSGWRKLASLPVGESTRPKIVCLCGSTRFYEHFQRANYDETMLGNIVLSVGFYPHAQKEMHHEEAGCTPEQKIGLDELHKRKIDLADEVFVLNVGGYIGSSTRSEIDYAEAHGKPVRYLLELGLGESREPLPGDVSKSSNETRNI